MPRPDECQFSTCKMAVDVDPLIPRDAHFGVVADGRAAAGIGDSGAKPVLGVRVEIPPVAIPKGTPDYVLPVESGRTKRGLVKCARCQSSGCSPPSWDRSGPVRSVPSR